MNAIEFQQIVTSFSDSPADLLFNKGKLLVQVRDEIIEATVSQSGSGLMVTETGSLPISALAWIVNRLARVPQLADRILSYVEPVEHFVSPRALFLDDVNVADSDVQPEVEAGPWICEVLGRRPAGTSSVLYLTSDAGEGKTTMISELARDQAQRYKLRETDWLLVPISLGGRPFMRFDDVVIGALVNRFRFPFFYYDAFLELVRLGVLVPAFDGFEEVFIEGASGEALSALGGLVNGLRSSGSMLVSARKAYFEYRNFGQTARLFDAIGSDSVVFSRLALRRWSEIEFGQYGELRGVSDADQIFERISRRLGGEHPILTRAVLVKRLFDVADSVSGTDELLEKLGSSSGDYFVEFVGAIIEREANEKWTDRSGKVALPLLEVSEHHELLSMVALEMWISGTDTLKQEIVDVIADVFSEQRKKSPVIARQVKERLRQHALLSYDDGTRAVYSFDHEDFRKFFLGQAVSVALATGAKGDLQTALRKGQFARETCESAAEFIRRKELSPAEVILTLVAIAKTDSSTSFTRENVGAIVIRLLAGYTPDRELMVRGLTFPLEALREVSLSRLHFEDCFFLSTPVESSELRDCTFERCQFEALDLFASSRLSNCLLDHCEVAKVGIGSDGIRSFDPGTINARLREFGFSVKDQSPDVQPAPRVEPDERCVLAERAFRLFLRNTHVNESVFRLRLGVKGNHFVDNVLPALLRAGIVEQVDYLGSGRQRRFRLAVRMQRVEEALRGAGGDFENLLKLLAHK